MRFDCCKANLHTACEEHKYDHCEMCNIARAYQHGYETAQEDMSKDAVEVVRCKDCKHKYVSGNGTTQYYVCDFMDAQYEENGFCHHAEREIKE